MLGSRNTSDIWRFFGPLAAVSVLFLSGRLFQNFALLHFPDGVRQIATFTLASSVFFPCMSAVNFFPQLANTLVKGRRDLRTVGRFSLMTCTLLSCVFWGIAWTPAGKEFVGSVFPSSDDVLADIVYYLRWYSPVVFLTGLVNFVSGLLMQCHRTGWVSCLRVASLVSLVLVLSVGLFWDVEARLIIGISCVLPELVAAILGLWCLKKRVDLKEGGSAVISYRETWIFFWPLALTTAMFTLSRPIINQLVTVAGSRVEIENWTEEVLAALAVAFGFSMIFQMTINQLRNVYVTFALERPEDTRAFARQLILGLTVIMALVAMTPFARWFFEHLQGLEGRPLEWALDNYVVLCAVPVVVGLRNHFHGLAMAHRRTAIMGAASIMRNISVMIVGWLLITMDKFEPWIGAVLLLVGFSVEAAIVRADARRRKKATLAQEANLPV
ncbi:MAG: hypothetical protein ACPGN3_10570 [Opitutales bacterium]